jgi:alkylation response protein AidB-like acyl-CoA dehydrogenase
VTTRPPAAVSSSSASPLELDLGLVAERALGDEVDTDVVRRADALRDLLAANASQCEAERRISQANLDALEEAGLFDVLAPKRVGGMGASMATQLAVASSLAGGCASTAWVQTIFCGSRWWVGTLASPRAQAEIFDAGSAPLVAGVLGANGPSGVARPGDGGFVVSGRWPFASGSLHADWAILGVAFVDEAGATVDEGIVLTDVASLSVEDTWFVAGMAGTGSNTFVADEVFVPAHRAVSGEVLASGIATPSEPSDRWPTLSVLTLLLMGTVLGTARQVLQSVAEGTLRRGISYSSYRRQVDSMVVVRTIARSSLDLDTAWFHLLQAASDIDAAGHGTEMDALRRGRLRGSCGYASALVRDTVSSLMDIAGASAFAASSPLQRHWRDLNTASRHAFLGAEPMLELYGRAIFGLDQVFGPI